MIGFCADGASVNFGCREGVVAKLAAEMPWVLGIYCIAHRLELASKDAFKDSFFTKEVGVLYIPLIIVLFFYI